ncbi:hypothetical protein B0H17DRAFT_1334722 [Mycena rosella]|uniref:Uncharacterized protein n=1 Tax=Mycena rosella TaxID=1033263 RepID=A0AAD7GA77_MYCRO|nr:hypothetical protein B0H17DRAFT_1334722 [Mycena rosella]
MEELPRAHFAPELADLLASEMFDFNQMRPILCTVAIINGAILDAPPITYTSEPMLVGHSFLADRSGVCAINVPTLVALLRESVAASQSPIPAVLQSILDSSISTELSTTRVPFFKQDWQDIGYGYRKLANFAPATATMTVPQAFCQPHIEVFAVDSSHPETVNYMRIWGVMVIQSDSHFVIAFQTPTTLGLPLLAGSRLSSLAPSFHTSSGHTRHNSHLSLGLTQASREFSASPVPSPLSEFPLKIFGDHLVAGTTFAEACIVLNLSIVDVANARFKGTQQAKQLVTMVQNWTSAALVLAKFCVSPQKLSHQFSGGLSVNFDMILTELGWTKSSYIKKAKWYLWAAEAATLFWYKAMVPAEADSDFALYRIWKAICFIWKVGGPVTTGIAPAKMSNDPDEKDAAALTQQTIESSKTNLSKKLVADDPADEPA